MRAEAVKKHNEMKQSLTLVATAALNTNAPMPKTLSWQANTMYSAIPLKQLCSMSP